MATVAAIAPFLVVIAIRAGHHYLLTQDLAVIDLRARDLFSTAPPLTGPWSRAGFAHPGPLYYWILGALSAVTAQASWSILVGGAVVRIVGIVATARLAWVRGGLALCLLTVAAITAAQVALEPGSLVVPWNIFAALAFYPVFLLLAWSVVLGEVRRLPWLVVVGTFLVQTHIGYGAAAARAVGLGRDPRLARPPRLPRAAPCGARSGGASGGSSCCGSRCSSTSCS